MFGYVWNKNLGAGVLILVSKFYTKEELDVLLSTTQTSLLDLDSSLGYCSVSNVIVNEASRAIASSSNPNSQVPRYGKRASLGLGTLGTFKTLRSGEILGALVSAGDPITNVMFLTYGVGKEVIGTHKYLALGSPEPTITLGSSYTYYYD